MSKEMIDALKADGENLANARLISAAPDMLAALKMARGYVDLAGEDLGRDVGPDLAIIDAAIAKAEPALSLSVDGGGK